MTVRRTLCLSIAVPLWRSGPARESVLDAPAIWIATNADSAPGPDPRRGTAILRGRSADFDSVSSFVGYIFRTRAKAFARFGRDPDLRKEIDTPQAVRGVVRSWTTTGRLSLWARGQLALSDPSGRLDDWLRCILTAGAERLTVQPPLAAAIIPFARQLPPAQGGLTCCTSGPIHLRPPAPGTRGFEQAQYSTVLA